MSDRVFVDTNVLVYAHDIDAPEKQPIAVEIISRLWQSRTGIISSQVLQELYVTLTRKIPTPIARTTARQLVKTYLAWEVAQPDGPIMLHAIDIEDTFKLSFWDALIIAAAYSKNATILLTEDLSDGQQIEGITVMNPFRNAAQS